MKLSMTYRVRTKGFNHIFNETVRLYRQAVSFFVDVCRNYGNRFPIYLMTHVQTPEFRESFFAVGTWSHVIEFFFLRHFMHLRP